MTLFNAVYFIRRINCLSSTFATFFFFPKTDPLVFCTWQWVQFQRFWTGSWWWKNNPLGDKKKMSAFSWVNKIVSKCFNSVSQFIVSHWKSATHSCGQLEAIRKSVASIINMAKSPFFDTIVVLTRFENSHTTTMASYVRSQTTLCYDRERKLPRVAWKGILGDSSPLGHGWKVKTGSG